MRKHFGKKSTINDYKERMNFNCPLHNGLWLPCGISSIGYCGFTTRLPLVIYPTTSYRSLRVFDPHHSVLRTLFSLYYCSLKLAFLQLRCMFILTFKRYYRIWFFYIINRGDIFVIVFSKLFQSLLNIK